VIPVPECTAKAICPGGARRNQTVHCSGEHGWSITNDGDKPMFVTIEALLYDSSGNSDRQSEDACIEAGKSGSGAFRTGFPASYKDKGYVQLTAETRVTGDTAGVASNGCQFNVA